MPLTEDNFEQFYLGNGAEFRLISDLFLHGLEAYKPNPDIGFDILVTNKGLAKFRGETEFHKYLQVKSTFMISSEASFFLTENDVNELIEDNHATTVFCYFHPDFEADPQSFERGDFEPWQESLDSSYMEHMYNNHFREIKKNGCLTQLDFKQFQMEYFWLNNSQLKKAVDTGVFQKQPENSLFKMSIRNVDGFLYTSDGDGFESNLVGEIRNIYYVFKECRGKGRLLDGDFLQSHY